jgi:hypothetical protein
MRSPEFTAEASLERSTLHYASFSNMARCVAAPLLTPQLQVHSPTTWVTPCIAALFRCSEGVPEACSFYNTYCNCCESQACSDCRCCDFYSDDPRLCTLFRQKACGVCDRFAIKTGCNRCCGVGL